MPRITDTTQIGGSVCGRRGQRP